MFANMHIFFSLMCREPDFNNLKIGSLVLAKSCEGGLWSRAVVLDVTHGTSNNDGSCVVKYETKGLFSIGIFSITWSRRNSSDAICLDAVHY